jgi:hypothetical protein
MVMSLHFYSLLISLQRRNQVTPRLLGWAVTKQSLEFDHPLCLSRGQWRHLSLYFVFYSGYQFKPICEGPTPDKLKGDRTYP